MPMLGQAALAMWWDVGPDARQELEHWHAHEHVPERLGIPGFLRASRWTVSDGGEGSFMMYELQDHAVLASPAYVARLNAPSPWSTRMMPLHRNMVRTQCRVLLSQGGVTGRHILTIRCAPEPGRADAMVDGPLGKMLSTRLADKGIVVLGFFDLGFRNVTNSKRPILKGEDLDGLKLRVIPNPVFIETFKTFKANPVPMPFAELYGALENKAVDGQENPYAVILSSKLYEVNKFVSETNHVYATNPIQISKRFWEKLTPAEQKLLQDAATEAQNYQRVASREVSSKAVAELKAKGMVHNEIPAAEQARMRAAVKAVHDKFAAAYEPAVVNLFRTELERVSKL